MTRGSKLPRMSCSVGNAKLLAQKWPESLTLAYLDRFWQGLGEKFRNSVGIPLWIIAKTDDMVYSSRPQCMEIDRAGRADRRTVQLACIGWRDEGIMPRLNQHQRCGNFRNHFDRGNWAKLHSANPFRHAKGEIFGKGRPAHPSDRPDMLPPGSSPRRGIPGSPRRCPARVDG